MKMPSNNPQSSLETYSCLFFIRKIFAKEKMVYLLGLGLIREIYEVTGNMNTLIAMKNHRKRLKVMMMI